MVLDFNVPTGTEVPFKFTYFSPSGGSTAHHCLVSHEAMTGDATTENSMCSRSEPSISQVVLTDSSDFPR